MDIFKRQILFCRCDTLSYIYNNIPKYAHIKMKISIYLLFDSRIVKCQNVCVCVYVLGLKL